MKQTYCNPLDLAYRYQHVKEGPRVCGFREGADPTLVRFKGRYYLFVSMSAGFWHSTDLLNWEFRAAPDLLIYDYAPDVRQVGDLPLFLCQPPGRKLPHSALQGPADGGVHPSLRPLRFLGPGPVLRR